MNELKIEYIDINQLTPYENNARKHQANDVNAIKKSIETFGMNDPIGVWSAKNIIVEGHGRLIALKELGYDKVPCIRLDQLTDDQRKAYALAHNKTAELSEWDFSKLEEELKIIDLDMAQFGFEQLLDSLEELPEDDEFDADTELEKDAFVKRGDIWLLGRHKLMCGDSTTSDVEKLMEGKYADLVVTDSPYNVDYEGGNGDKIQNDNMSSVDFYEFLNKAFANVYKILKPGAAFYEFFATREHVNFENALKANGLTPRQELIWYKNGQFTLGRQDYQWDFEPLFYSWREGAPHNWYSDRKQKCVLCFDKPKKNEYHPTQKVVPLISYLIKNSSKPHDLVVDLFGGSGTTLIAAHETSRDCYLMEIDEKYASAIVRRYCKTIGGTDGVYCIRDGEKLNGCDIYKPEEPILN